MATYTTVGLCNHALVLCGASSITALTDDTPNARTLNSIYENARKGFLTECRWTFSLTRSMLVTVATTTIAWLKPEETNAYTKPTAALRIWEVSEIKAIWRSESNLIISNTASLGTLYTYDHSEVGLWSPKAILAFIDKLCSEICFHILHSDTKAKLFLEKYEKVSLPNAMSEESQTGTHQEVIDDEWLGSKYGGGNPSRSYD